MALSFSHIPKHYQISKYRYKKIENDKILVTSVNGGWIILTEEEFNLLRRERVEKKPELFRQLEEEGLVITSRSIERAVEMFKNHKSFLFEANSLHIITVTLRCNHRCIYCHAKSVPENTRGFDMDEKMAKKTVEFIFQSPSKHITIEFQGGEPLLNFPIIEYIVEYSKELAKTHQKTLHFNIVSNFSVMDDDILRFLMRNNFNINTSLDGPKELHDKNRIFVGGSSYDKVVEWIKIIKEDYLYPLSAMPTITKFSLPFCKEIVDEYCKHGFSEIRIRPMNNAGFAHERWQQIGYSAQEFVDFWKKTLDYIIKLNKEGKKIKEDFVMLALTKLILKKYPHYTCWGSPCGAAISQCGYNYNGDIYMCDEARSFEIFKIGNVNQSYKEVFNSVGVANIVNLTSTLQNKCESCVWKPFCGPCLVCTFGQQNRLIGNMNVDAECFIRQNILEEVVRRLRKEEKSILLGWIGQSI